jgi:hypothetical protein
MVVNRLEKASLGVSSEGRFDAREDWTRVALGGPPLNRTGAVMRRFFNAINLGISDRLFDLNIDASSR